MNPIRVLIVDDEPLARRGVRQLLAAYPEFTVAGESRDGREALRALGTLEPDLVFLDVQMPGLDGLGVIRAYGAERMPFTVFVTAYDAFAVRAFEAHAIDYLVKPLSESRFRQTIERVRERFRLRDAVALAGQLSALLGVAPATAEVPRPSGSAAPTIAVPTGQGELLLDQGEIDWIEADDYQAVIHSRGRAYRVRESLSALMARLHPARFLRVHRSAIVRLDQVREWRGGDDARDAQVLLRDGTEIPVSRRRLAEVKSLLRPAGPRG
ncbi:MAG TPA: LytTR family DNA-binding domain-containing protein [Gemmatimonadales bacterium]|nr:LytTR family DNA-binding domain-containing protein [Gemmatimonadales bacterium]